MQEEIVTLERMSYGADAIAHNAEGKTLFVSGGVTGDVVRVAYDTHSDRYAQAHVSELIEPSSLRQQSFCPYAEVCGGCSWALLTYQAQLDAKYQQVFDALTRIGRFDTDIVQGLLMPVVPSKRTHDYRNKIELQCHYDERGLHLGFAHPQSHVQVQVENCPLFAHPAKKIVKHLQGALRYATDPHESPLERVGLRYSRRTKAFEIALWTQPGPFPRASVAHILTSGNLNPTSIVRVLQKGPIKARRVTGVERLFGSGRWTENFLDASMQLSAPSFFQINTAQAERMVTQTLAYLNLAGTETVMDLYCGAGTFTLPLAQRAREVHAVEALGTAVRDLQRNVEHAGLEKVHWQGGDVAKRFPDVKADAIVVDPPRSGLHPQVCQHLREQHVNKLVYVSCNPATLARDLARLCQDNVYRIEQITPFDLFPQTHHVECVCLMTRV